MKMGEGKALTGVCASVIISLCYCYFISSRIPKGKLRFISLLPIFYLFTTLPLYLSSALTTGITSFFITWLANSKLLLFCFDQGPLSWGGPAKSLLTFVAMAAFPCKIKETKNHTKPKKIPLNLPTQILLVAILVTLLHNNRERNYIHPKMVLVVYCFLLYLMLDVIVASATTVLRAAVGLEMEAVSDEPYLSTSLQDFWGRRWNLMVTNTLRHTIFQPVKSASAGLLGKDMASLVAVFATFVVSALMHELILYYLVRAPSTWKMGSFFLLHGVCVVAEMIVKRVFADRWQLPPLVSGVLAVGFMAVTGFWLFFPPMIDNGLDVKVFVVPLNQEDKPDPKQGQFDITPIKCFSTSSSAISSLLFFNNPWRIRRCLHQFVGDADGLLKLCGPRLLS